MAPATRLVRVPQLVDVEAARRHFKTTSPQNQGGRHAIRQTRAMFFPAGL